MSSYVTYGELQTLALPASALTGISTSDQQAACDKASGIADGYLADRFVLPISTPDDGLKMAVASIAAFNLMKRRGFNPDSPSDNALRMGYEDAMRWLRDVSAGKATPPGIVDAHTGDRGGPFVSQGAPDPDNEGSFVVNPPSPRGW